MKSLKALTLISVLLLGGCVVRSYCEGEQDYESDRSIPVLQPADGMKIKDSASALKIPPVPANPVPYGEPFKDKDGDTAVRCLDRPPEMPASAEPMPAEKPAEKPAG